MTDVPSLKGLLPYFVFIGTLTAYIAHSKRGRKPIPWFFLGFFFGLLALLILFCIPKKQSLSLEPILLKGNISHPLTPTTPTIQIESLPMIREFWYFLDQDHKQVGPVSFQGLKNNYLEGKISNSSYVWNGQLDNWERLEALPEYLSLIEERIT